MPPEQIIPFIGMDLDTSPLKLESSNGMYQFVKNALVNNPYTGDYGVLTNLKGNEVVDATNIIADGDVVIGGYRDDIYNTYFYFVTNEDTSEEKILRYYPELNQIQVIIKGANLVLREKITGVSFIDSFLGYTDFTEQGRFIDVEKGNRTGKLTKISVLFGVLDTGVTIFKTGQEYYISLVYPDGTVIAPVLVYTAIPADENDLALGAEHYAEGVNLALTGLVTATACGCGEVEIVASYIGTNYWTCMLIEATTIVPVGGSNILSVYENIIPDNFQEYNILRAHYAPKVQPAANYESDPAVETNFLKGNVFQFAYTYLYKRGIRSTQSPVSEIPLSITDCTGQPNQFSNYIDVDFTGDGLLLDPAFLSDIEGVELLVRFGNTAEWKVIRQLKKCDLGVIRNFYKWYNDQILTGIDPLLALKLYERIPITHKAEENATPANMEGLRGFIGNGLVDYDNLCPDIRISTEEEEIAPCSRLYDITIKLWIRQVYIDNPATDNILQPLWRHTGKHTDSAQFGPNYCVFGGLASSAAIGGFVTGIDTDYQQVLPEAEFYAYLLGTDYRANFVQNHAPSVTDYVDFAKGIYNGTTSGQRGDIRNAIANDEVFCVAVIKNVPHGKYQIGMPSHWCSPDGVYIDGDYKLNNGRRYQGTSTYTLAIGNLASAKTAGNAPYTNERLITIELPFDNSGTSNIPIPAPYDFIIGDLTDPRDLTSSVVYDGYVMDSLNGSQSQSALYQGVKMERQTISCVGLCPYGMQFPSTPSYLWTDQNGFFFYTCATPPFANFRAKSAFNNIFSLTDGKIEGTLKNLETGTGSAGIIDLQQWGNNNAKHYIFPKYTSTLALQPNTVVITVIDQNNDPVQGVLVTAFMCGRPELTDSNGQASIKIYGFEDTGWSISVPALQFEVFLAIGNGCCMDLTANWSKIVTTWTNPTYPEGQIFTPSPYSITIKYSIDVNWWLHGGEWKIGIEYLDAQNRSTTVQWNPEMVLSVPFWNVTSNKVVPKIEIHNLPPQDPLIVSYQLLVAKNKLKLKVQIIVNEATYFIFYNDDTNKQQTTFGSGSATEVHISLQSIDYFNFQHHNSSVGYQFEEGDLLRFISNENGVYFTGFWEFPIRTVIGNNLVIESTNNLFEIKTGMLIGIYRPQPQTDEPVFYEFGQRWGFTEIDGVKYHNGGESYLNTVPAITAQNQTSSQPAILALPRGDIYVHDRVMKALNYSQTFIRSCESVHISDYYLSDSWSIGRINTIDINNRQRLAESLVIFSNIFRPYTEVNGLCNFDGENYKNLPFSQSGAVNCLKFVDGVMLAICQNRLVSLYIGENMIQSSNGESTLSISNAIIGGYNVIETVFKFGGTMHPESVVVIGGYAFWYSYQDGAVIRYSSNAPFPISDKGMSQVFRDSINITNPTENVVATYNPKTEEYLISIRTKLLGIEGRYVFTYNVRQELWKTTYEYPATWLGSTKFGLIQFDGDSNLWKEGEGDYNTWFDTFYPIKVQIVFNEREEIEKFMNYLKIHSIFENNPPDKWSVDSIVVSKPNGYTQISEINKANFTIRNGLYFSVFKRDSSDTTVPNPLVNGGVLKGNYAVLTLSCANTQKTTLKELIIGYTTAGK